MRPLDNALDVHALHREPARTPAFAFDLTGIDDTAAGLSHFASRAGCSVLYAIKALAPDPVVAAIARRLDGLAASSLTEAKLARAVLDRIGLDRIEDDKPRTLQFTSPGLRPDEFDELAATCDALVFNSLTQWQRFAARQGASHVECGLRINPQLSSVADQRCDPCRPHSKLGVPLDQLTNELTARPEQFKKISGLHFHTHHRAASASPLSATVEKLATTIGPLLRQAAWLNLGGGYQFAEMNDQQVQRFCDVVGWLRSKFDLQVLIEPGSALVRSHGYLIATVTDVFDSEGQTIAVLDTSVAHLPEVFEFQRAPTLVEHVPGGQFAATLVGASCLAGDVFGQYRFDAPPVEGARYVFRDVGAYALSKVQQFNGLRPPETCMLTRKVVPELAAVGHD